MNKKLGRLFWPGLWVYFVVMAAFVVAAALLEQWILAGVEAAALLLVIGFYLYCRTKRKRSIQQFVKSAFNSYESVSGTDTPFPMALIRLGDNNLLWANDRFSQITGYQPRYLEQPLKGILPNLSTEWLADGKHEYPYDMTIGDRRYRIYGTTTRADDPEQIGRAHV